MRYLADLHISPLTIRALQAKGYEIFREILDLARQQRAVLITADLDFSALIATSRERGPKA